MVLLGSSRSGKSSIAREIEAQGLLSHFEIDTLAKYLDAFSNDEITSRASDWILGTALRKFPRGLVIEGGYLSRSFMCRDARHVKWGKFQSWTGILSRHSTKGFVAVTNATEGEYLDTIRRGRAAGTCWSLRTLQEAELPCFAASCHRSNKLNQEIAANGSLDAIPMSIASRAEHVRSIAKAVEQMKACI